MLMQAPDEVRANDLFAIGHRWMEIFPAFFPIIWRAERRWRRAWRSGLSDLTGPGRPYCGALTVGKRTLCDFLKALLKAVPYKIHTVLTDNGIQFADLPKNRTKPTALWRGHLFDRTCEDSDIEHRLTKPNHPRTNGQVERMNRTLKEATVKRYHYGTFRILEAARSR
jgi:hypothetical protein